MLAALHSWNRFRPASNTQPEAAQIRAEPDPALLRLRRISKRYGQTVAVKSLDLEIRRGDFFAILGPSGCGKTTLLRIIGGFVPPTTGEVEIEGRVVTHLGPERRPTNMVFQGYGLFPHMSVRQNIAYGLRIAKVARREIEARVAEAIALVRLEELRDRSVHELSGGQQQRVALARALIMRPPVLLLDEPLAALDLKLRQAMQDELRRIHHQIGGTFVFVTHDQGEAMSLANRIAVMDQGEPVQVGTPEEVYRRPRSRFVATFVGEANLLRGRRENGVVALDVGPTVEDRGPDGPVDVIVRPEAVSFVDTPAAEFVAVVGSLSEIVFMGSIVRYTIALAGGQSLVVQEDSERARRDLRPGMPVRIGWARDRQTVLAG